MAHEDFAAAHNFPPLGDGRNPRYGTQYLAIRGKIESVAATIENTTSPGGPPMNFRVKASAVLIAWMSLAGPPAASAQERLLLSVCNGEPKAAACSAVRGDRAEGWTAQGRSEVMAPHGIVTTSQPLAAEAGLAIMRSGGNAIDAAVATAAMLNLVEPESTGLAGDL